MTFRGGGRGGSEEGAVGCGGGAGGVGHGFVHRNWVGVDEGLETSWGKEATDEDVKETRGLRFLREDFTARRSRYRTTIMCPRTYMHVQKMD